MHKIIIILLLIFFFAGCATVPVKEALPTYQIDGAAYVPLVVLCQRLGVNLDYDTFTRAVTLTKDSHKINMMAGQDLVLVDGAERRLKQLVCFYQGTIAVPYQAKKEIFDVLFKADVISSQGSVAPLSTIKKVIIDAGHGGKDPGAISRNGLKEKDINLDIAKNLGNRLNSDGIEVIYTRSNDKFISLEERVNIANSSDAELFVSVHTNASRARHVNGFEVYYISRDANDTERALYAAQNFKLNLDSSCFASDSLDLKTTVWDLIYAHNRLESVELASDICRKIKDDLSAKILGIKGAKFIVLKGARMPAVLIEVGFLSNKNEELLLRSGYYRRQLAQTIACGIEKYANNRLIMEASKR